MIFLYVTFTALSEFIISNCWLLVAGTWDLELNLTEWNFFIINSITT